MMKTIRNPPHAISTTKDLGAAGGLGSAAGLGSESEEGVAFSVIAASSRGGVCCGWTGRPSNSSSSQ
ncbi:hypothetical protein ACFX1Q_044482 [Malus domestica]